VVSLLKATRTRWAAATIGSMSAAPLQLASGGKAVMAIGGFSGSDASPTLAQFKTYVRRRRDQLLRRWPRVRPGIGRGGDGAGTGSAITAWVGVLDPRLHSRAEV